MNKDNETCNQRVIFRFYYSRSADRKRSGKRLLNLHPTGPKADPDKVRELKDYLVRRLERIAEMMEILLQVHDDWAVTERREYFQMETVSCEFGEAVRLLDEHGFTKDEYILEVEYTRKWGVL